MLGPSHPILTDTAPTVPVKRTGSGLHLRALRLGHDALRGSKGCKLIIRGHIAKPRADRVACSPTWHKQAAGYRPVFSASRDKGVQLPVTGT